MQSPGRQRQLSTARGDGRDTTLGTHGGTGANSNCNPREVSPCPSEVDGEGGGLVTGPRALSFIGAQHWGGGSFHKSDADKSGP